MRHPQSARWSVSFSSHCQASTRSVAASEQVRRGGKWKVTVIQASFSFFSNCSACRVARNGAVHSRKFDHIIRCLHSSFFALRYQLHSSDTGRKLHSRKNNWKHDMVLLRKLFKFPLNPHKGHGAQTLKRAKTIVSCIGLYCCYMPADAPNCKWYFICFDG